jgi:hypothetical protein
MKCVECVKCGVAHEWVKAMNDKRSLIKIIISNFRKQLIHLQLLLNINFFRIEL